MPHEIFIHADRVFDGTDVRVDTAVAIDGGTISRVVPVADVPADATVHRFEGATVSPGLIDSHVHMTPWMVFGLIAAGVTTVRDLGNDVEAMERLLDGLGDVPTPTIYWSGPLLEGHDVNWPSIARRHDTVEQVRATVDELASRGMRSIKLYYNATPEIVAAAADQAHRHGMRVLGHVGASSLAEVVAGGVDEVQHLAGCLAADLGYDDWATSARHLAGHPVDHCTTLVVWDAMAHLGEPRALRDVGLDWVHPHALAAWAGAHHATQPAAERVNRSRDLIERMAAIPHLREAGRNILVGSDAPFPGLVPGFSLHDEAGLLVESGMPALDVMRAMTSGNARHMGISDAGTIIEGATADLVVFTGNPTDRIADLSRIAGVWRQGAEVDLVAWAEHARVAFALDATSPVDELAKSRYIPATVTR